MGNFKGFWIDLLVGLAFVTGWPVLLIYAPVVLLQECSYELDEMQRKKLERRHKAMVQQLRDQKDKVRAQMGYTQGPDGVYILPEKSGEPD